MTANIIPFNPLDKKNLGASVAEAMLAKRMVRSTGYYNPTRPEYMATDDYRTAFALGGAQAVADLILGEQAQRVPAQPVLPA